MSCFLIYPHLLLVQGSHQRPVLFNSVVELEGLCGKLALEVTPEGGLPTFSLFKAGRGCVKYAEVSGERRGRWEKLGQRALIASSVVATMCHEICVFVSPLTFIQKSKWVILHLSVARIILPNWAGGDERSESRKGYGVR